MLSEVWHDIVGYEGLYQVSSLGRIKSCARTAPCGLGRLRSVRERIMKCQITPKGYKQIDLTRDGKGKNYLVHRLVCEAFHGPPPTELHQAAHGPVGNTDNSAENLRWATAQENCADKVRDGTQPFGISTHLAKLSEGDVAEIRHTHSGRYGDSAKLSRKFGISRSQVVAIVKGRSWKHLLEEAA